MNVPWSLVEEMLPRFDASEVHDVWVITETRIEGTSPDATRPMLSYWRVIRLGRVRFAGAGLAAIRRCTVRTVNVSARRD